MPNEIQAVRETRLSGYRDPDPVEPRPANNTNEALEGRGYPNWAAPPANVNVKEKSLKNGWEEVTFNNHPKVKYWHKKNTGERQWWEPNGKPSNDPSVKVNNNSVPSGWSKMKHKNDNSDPPLYWYESNDGNVRWNLKNLNKTNKNKVNNAVNNAKKNVKKAANTVANANAASGNALDPVLKQLEIVENKLQEVQKAIGTAPTAGGGRRKTQRRGRKGRKTRGRRRY